ncbi:prefoldin subunit alpha [Candidatus Woesearchaeota archaeon]|nr:prefoldin subunit alpha [Candidatus Woesearchaeota archaeon]
MEAEHQEKHLLYQFLEEQVKQIKEQIEKVDEQLGEVTEMKNALQEFAVLQPGSSLLVPLANGIFCQAVLQKTDALTINVGSDVCVEKDLATTQELVQKQQEQLKEYRAKLIKQLELILHHTEQLKDELASLHE